MHRLGANLLRVLGLLRAVLVGVDKLEYEARVGPRLLESSQEGLAEAALDAAEPGAEGNPNLQVVDRPSPQLHAPMLVDHLPLRVEVDIRGRVDGGVSARMRVLPVHTASS
jgi:hypothetical protein